MDLKQQKLTKKEWEFLEVPVNYKEKEILDLIYKSFNNVDFTKNETNSLLLYLKISTNDLNFHQYLFEKYFLKSFSSRLAEYSNPEIEVNSKNVTSNFLIF